jgi:hypothetical protein
VTGWFFLPTFYTIRSIPVWSQWLTIVILANLGKKLAREKEKKASETLSQPIKAGHGCTLVIPAIQEVK